MNRNRVGEILSRDRGSRSRHFGGMLGRRLGLTGIGWVEYWVEMVGAGVGMLVGYSVGGLV
jgi:hypothetical protein